MFIGDGLGTCLKCAQPVRGRYRGWAGWIANPSGCSVGASRPTSVFFEKRRLS